jgi:hypothetical protein
MTPEQIAWVAGILEGEGSFLNGAWCVTGDSNPDRPA